jgi:hypothetical protein
MIAEHAGQTEFLFESGMTGPLTVSLRYMIHEKKLILQLTLILFC